MAEPVVIDHLPVQLTAEQQELWDSGHERTVRKLIREERLSKQYSDEEIASMEAAPSFDEVMADDDLVD